jgi:hypothetical protein
MVVSREVLSNHKIGNLMNAPKERLNKVVLSRRITHRDRRAELFKTIEHHLQICCIKKPICPDLM